MRSPANGMSPPSVGPDGSIYFSRSLSFLDAVNPGGDIRWTYFDGSIIDQPRVSPDGSVVVAGDRPNFGEPGTLRGWDAAAGTPALTTQLPTQDSGFGRRRPQREVAKTARQGDCAEPACRHEARRRLS